MQTTYNLSDRGRRALDQLHAHIAQINGARDVHHQFNVSPTSAQRLEDMQTEEVGFLSMINIIGVEELTGDIIGLSADQMIASRKARADLPRTPRYVGALQGRKYQLSTTLFDTWLPWEIIDQWAKFPDFAARYARRVARAVGQSRLSIGWNGTSVAATTNRTGNPLGQDVNIGWLQKLRLEKPAHVMGRALVTANGVQTATGAAVPIPIGADETYKNVDALAYDLISGMPSWARTSTDHVVIVSADLVDEKYFPMVNRVLGSTIDGGKATSDEVVAGVIRSQRQIGGRPAIIVPYFPEGTMAITPTENLSIYYQNGAQRRYVRDEPEMMAGLVDYNSGNEGYVIEDTDYMVMAENIAFG